MAGTFVPAGTFGAPYHAKTRVGLPRYGSAS